jgi:hypothetical protein
MMNRKFTLIAWLIAVVLTIVAWSQTLMWKSIPALHVVFWFPLLLIADSIAGGRNISAEVILSLMQFPFLAICFSIGIRRWRVFIVSSTLVCVYLTLVLVAYILYKKHM